MAPAAADQPALLADPNACGGRSNSSSSPAACMRADGSGAQLHADLPGEVAVHVRELGLTPRVVQVRRKNPTSPLAKQGARQSMPSGLDS